MQVTKSVAVFISAAVVGAVSGDYPCFYYLWDVDDHNHYVACNDNYYQLYSRSFYQWGP